MKKLRIIHFDVSQGESTLISLLAPGSDTHVLIDGGRKCRGQYVVRCLERLGVTRLHFAVCTHLDNDHHEGLVPVIRSGTITVSKLLVPKFGYNKEKFAGLNQACEDSGVDWEVATTDELLIDDDECELKIIHVGTPELKDDNVASIACLLRMNSFVYYTAGDLTSGIEDKLDDLSKHVCAFKCGHHGAETSTSEDLVDNIKPTAAFISAGRHVHGHPRQEIIKNLCDSNSLQRFYSTNCVNPRKGFIGGATGSFESKGMVCSNRNQGVLGHMVLYTDDKLSKNHDGAKVNFFVLRPPSSEIGTTWLAYKHVCGNAKHRPKEVLPGGIVHLGASQLPEFRLSALSPSLNTKKLKLGTAFDFNTFYDDYAVNKDPELAPSSPIHNFVEDPVNFSVTENKKNKGSNPTVTGTTVSKKRKLHEMQHASKLKRTSECIGCAQSPKQVDGDLIKCEHGEEWFLCEDCEDMFSPGFDCTRL
ncbi:MAG TPA: hypothetical protein VFZ09_25860 [Archangium sp.]|uniref:ComEC/Rec2 family competence protein n=1 Tax=Archangium sp. TaxID=1872627 RepID=UPI002E2FCC3D|nr:hypothetical protein [Archangium sp.]HEX5749683.1 hypothetical protein [Archangium sp.]